MYLFDFWRRIGFAAAACIGISLDDKLALTRFLSAAGANIQALNTVRKQLSRVKGGGLARACQGRHSGVFDLIRRIRRSSRFDCSGPTVIDNSTPLEASAFSINMIWAKGDCTAYLSIS